MRVTTAIILLILIALCTTPVAACMWDYDTLRDEQRGLPTVAAILAGKWEKHSPYFYEQRVERMWDHLAERPNNLDAIDNLAVALEKLGRVDEAIETLEPVVADHPDRYTAHANLGTFYLHRFIEHRDRADLDRGIKHIGRALEINPEAHFGREEYQLQLAKYVRASLDDPAVLDQGSFVIELLTGDRRGYEPATQPADWQERMRIQRVAGRRDESTMNDAIEGIVGMIRFGTGTSPHLYYALGDLLAARGDKHLAAWAYLRALEFDHPRPEQVREAIDQTIGPINYETGIEEIKAELEVAKADAAAWVAAYQAYEDALVRDGVDVTDEANYAAFYAEHGEARAEPGFSIEDYLPQDRLTRIALILGLALVAATFAAGFVVRWLWRRRRGTGPSAFA